jgi:hypothetical protein
LSVTVNIPVRVPAADGVKVTEIVQLAPAARLVPQVWVWAKSPEAAIETIVRAAVPEFVRVNVCPALVVPTVEEAKVRLVGVRLTEAVLPMPVPIRAMVCTAYGLVAFSELSVNVKEPETAPTMDGAKLIE